MVYIIRTLTEILLPETWKQLLVTVMGYNQKRFQFLCHRSPADALHGSARIFTSKTKLWPLAPCETGIWLALPQNAVQSFLNESSEEMPGLLSKPIGRNQTSLILANSRKLVRPSYSHAQVFCILCCTKYEDSIWSWQPVAEHQEPCEIKHIHTLTFLSEAMHNLSESASVAEKAQHEPQWPWLRIGWTHVFHSLRESKAAGSSLAISGLLGSAATDSMFISRVPNIPWMSPIFMSLKTACSPAVQPASASLMLAISWGSLTRAWTQA